MKTEHKSYKKFYNFVDKYLPITFWDNLDPDINYEHNIQKILVEQSEKFFESRNKINKEILKNIDLNKFRDLEKKEPNKKLLSKKMICQRS